jgi:hypothetical protein
MKWNAFEFVEPAIDKTRKLLFPIKLKYWFKLGFVSLLSAGNRFGSGSNFSFPSSSNKDSSITGNAISNLTDKINWTLVGVLAALFVVIGLIFTFIQSVFSFIFIDALVKKDYQIKKSWAQHKSKGISFFWLRLVMGLICLAVVVLIFLPAIIQIAQVGFKEFFSSASLLHLILTFLPSLIFLGLWIIIYSVFMTFVTDFALPESYKNSVGVWEAAKRTFRNLNNQKVEGLVYVLAKIVLGIAVAIISVIALVILLIPVLIVAGIIALITVLPAYFISKTAAIVVAIVIGIPYFLFALYVFIVAILPLTVFLRYLGLIAYENMFKTRILK